MRTNLKHKTLETFHFVIALNVMMILMIFVVIIFSTYAKRGIQIKLTNGISPVDNNSMGKIVLRIDNGILEMNGEKFQLIDLSRRMTKLKDAYKSGVVICPAFNVPINIVDSINDEFRKSGIKNITVQTSLDVF